MWTGEFSQMLHAISREMTVRCEATPLAITSQGIESPRCRSCESKLAIHQPDENAPEHLLGTCVDCGAWYLIEIVLDGTEAFLLDLPNIALFRAELAKEIQERKKGRAKKPESKSRRSKPKV
jgi:hypothetical protein